VQHSSDEILLYEDDQKIDVSLKKIRLDKNHKLAVCSFEPELPQSFAELYVDDLLMMINA